MISPDQTFSMTDEQFIESLNKLINDRITDASFSSADVLKALKVSQTLLYKKLDGLLGTDIDTYIMRIRVELVQDKLINTDLDLDKIASQTGYTDVEQMNSSFKRVTGKTVWSIRETS